MADQIPNDLIPEDLVPESTIPNDLVPATQTQPEQIAIPETLSTDIYGQVLTPPEELNKAAAQPIPPTPLQQFGQEMMAPIQQGERLLKSAARGAVSLPITFAAAAPVAPGETESIFTQGLKQVPGMEQLIEHKSEGWVENIAEFAGGLIAPEGAILAGKTPAARTLTRETLAKSQALEAANASIVREAKSITDPFSPLDLWTPQVPTVDNQTLGPVLQKELSGLVEAQAQFEKQLVDTEAKIAKGINPLIDREIEAKTRAMARMDQLSQEAAIATNIKNQTIAGTTDPAVIKAATIAESRAQGKLSQEAIKIGNNLQKERIRLLKQLKQKRDMREELTPIANKLQENLMKQEQLKQLMKRTPIAVEKTLDWTRLFGATNIPEQVHARGLQQARLVDDLVKGGFIKPELADAIRNSAYSEVLATNGIKLKSEKLFKYNILNETFRWGRIQKKTGIPTGESVQKTIWALNNGKNIQNQYKAALAKPIDALKKSGISLDEQTRILQYFEKLEDGRVVFNPSESTDATKLLVPAYRGPELTPDQIRAFSQLRDIYDTLAFEAGVPRLPRYVPIRELPQYMGVSTKTSADAIQNPSLAYARTSGQLIPGIHETNIATLSERYLREVARKKFISPALEEAADTLNQLHLSGLVNESEAFKKWMFDAFNINSEKSAAQVLGTYKLNQIKPAIDAFINELPNPDGALKQIYDSLSKAMAVKLVGINPTTWVKQFLQYPTLGNIELGERWAATGTKDALTLTRSGVERIANAKKILRASLIENAPILESEFSKAPTNAIAKGIDFLNAPARKLARRTMEKGEEFNRLQSVLGAQNKFSHYWEMGGEGGIQRLLSESALTAAQKQMVGRAYLSGGIENARDIYALLITQRINFAYGLADSPALLRSEFGRLFPFLTYSRNILTRGAEAVSEGRVKTLTDLVYKPLMMLAAFSGTTKALTGTGRTLPPGSEPFEAITDIQKYGISVAPQIMLKNAYKIISPVPFTVWDEAKFKKELDRKLEVFPEIGKSSPLYNELLKGFK